MENKILTEDEKYLFSEGTWLRCFEKLGAHLEQRGGEWGCRFAVWAPGVRQVFVAGDFNDWQPDRCPMTPGEGGLWYCFLPGLEEGAAYKYVIETRDGARSFKADPCAFWSEAPPATASRLADLDRYRWHDSLWLARRARRNLRSSPLNIYEVHLGSWMREEDGSYLSYSRLAETLIPYAVDMGYTHLELMPVMEHPFDGSWGYQITGYYAPTARYGAPREFMAFVDRCHQAGLGVILDWVPGHFCRDSHGLGRFTGEKLYEQGDHAQWGTYTFDLGRGEVKSFLKSNLLFWVERYHADGIRMDGVTSMLYLNFGEEDPGRKRYNAGGGEENLEAIAFIREANEAVSTRHPGVMLMAEESSAWPLVTAPPQDGGLGFHYKWDMGWMHDTLHYMQTDFPFRSGCHELLTFSMMYAFHENFILALSHDEVVHGKCSLIGRMPGDYWRQFAGLRLLALYQLCHPGTKLNFMGSEFAPFIEWRYYESLEWFLPRDYETHRKHQSYIKTLNALYRQEKALWQKDCSWEGFQWLDADNAEQSILTFLRRGKEPRDDLVVLLNFTPAAYQDYRLGVPAKGVYRELLNSDRTEFGGSGLHENPALTAEPVPCHGQEYSVAVRVPPIGGLILKRAGRKKEANPRR